MKRVDKHGVLTLHFDYPIGDLLNRTELFKIDSQLINITFYSEQDKESDRRFQEADQIKPVLESWTAINITDDEFLIQLNFSHPLLISLYSRPMQDFVDAEINGTQLLSIMTKNLDLEIYKISNMTKVRVPK